LGVRENKIKMKIEEFKIKVIVDLSLWSAIKMRIAGIKNFKKDILNSTKWKKNGCERK